MKRIILSVVFVLVCAVLTAVTIYDIQYTTTAGDGTFPSSYAGQSVTISGVVTGIDRNGKYYLSMPEGGAWKGIFVYSAAADHNINSGDLIEITAQVSEYNGLTELSNVTNFQYLGTATIPNAVSVTTSEISSGEAYEGVLVKVNNVTVTQEQNNYGEWFVTDGFGECQIDDGFFYLDDADITIINGQSWATIKGIVDYGYGQYAINPRSSADMSQTTSVQDKSWAKIKSLYK